MATNKKKLIRIVAISGAVFFVLLCAGVLYIVHGVAAYKQSVMEATKDWDAHQLERAKEDEKLNAEMKELEEKMKALGVVGEEKPSGSSDAPAQAVPTP